MNRNIFEKEVEKLSSCTESELLVMLVHGIMKLEWQKKALSIEIVKRGLGYFLDFRKAPISKEQYELYDAHVDFDSNMIFSPDGVETYAICTDGLVQIKTK